MKKNISKNNYILPVDVITKYQLDIYLVKIYNLVTMTTTTHHTTKYYYYISKTRVILLKFGHSICITEA